MVLSEDNTVFIHFERMGSGIRLLKDKINEVLRLLSNLSKENIVENLIACDIDIDLPYTWTYIKINKPKGFRIKEYVIDIEDESEFKSKIQIRMDNKICLKFKGIDDIYQIIQKVL